MDNFSRKLNLNNYVFKFQTVFILLQKANEEYNCNCGKIIISDLNKIEQLKFQ